MTDAFSDLVMPIFREVIDLQNKLSWRDMPSLEVVKKQTCGLIETTERKARADPGLEFDFSLARYGFLAWIDEVLTYSRWGESVGWGKPTGEGDHGDSQPEASLNQKIVGSAQTHTLEWEFEGTNHRAWRFYRKAEEVYDAVSQSRCSTDALEVYLLCVALGFLGDFRFKPEELPGWVERIYTKVTEASPMAPKPFADDPPGPPPPGLVPRLGAELLLRVSILAAITAAATLAGYLASVHYSLNIQASN